MSLYHCVCGEKTDVIDTRSSYKRLRRRRKCKAGHRFSTIEVPLESTTDVKKMVTFWATEIGEIDTDMIVSISESIDQIMLGTHPPDR